MYASASSQTQQAEDGPMPGGDSQGGPTQQGAAGNDGETVDANFKVVD